MGEGCHLCFSSEIIFFKVKVCLHLFKWNFLKKRKKNLLLCKNVIPKRKNWWNFVSCENFVQSLQAEGEDYPSCLAMKEYSIVKLY